MTMLEKMARAVYPTIAFLHDFEANGFLPFDEELVADPPSYTIQTSYEVARAALQAIREPDGDTVLAGMNSDWQAYPFGQSHGHLFTAMIDHILQEGQR